MVVGDKFDRTALGEGIQFLVYLHTNGIYYFYLDFFELSNSHFGQYCIFLFVFAEDPRLPVVGSRLASFYFSISTFRPKNIRPFGPLFLLHRSLV